MEPIEFLWDVNTDTIASGNSLESGLFPQSGPYRFKLKLFSRRDFWGQHWVRLNDLNLYMVDSPETELPEILVLIEKVDSDGLIQICLQKVQNLCKELPYVNLYNDSKAKCDKIRLGDKIPSVTLRVTICPVAKVPLPTPLDNSELIFEQSENANVPEELHQSDNERDISTPDNSYIFEMETNSDNTLSNDAQLNCYETESATVEEELKEVGLVGDISPADDSNNSMETGSEEDQLDQAEIEPSINHQTYTQWEIDEHADFEIWTIDGYSFRVSKSTLVGNRDVFRGLLSLAWPHSRLGCVEANFDSNVIFQLLNLLYGEELLTTTVAQKLFRAADYYNIDSLKKVCVAYLGKHMSFESLNSSLRLAHSTVPPNEALVEKSLQFIHKHSRNAKMFEDLEVLYAEIPGLSAKINLFLAPKRSPLAKCRFSSRRQSH